MGPRRTAVDDVCAGPCGLRLQAESIRGEAGHAESVAPEPTRVSRCNARGVHFARDWESGQRACVIRVAGARAVRSGCSGGKRFGVEVEQTCLDCAERMDVSPMMPGYWGSEYFTDQWYGANEMPSVLRVWSHQVEEAVFSEYRANLFFRYADWTWPLHPRQWAWLSERVSSASNALRRVSTARIDQARVVPNSPPRLRHCVVCGRHFLERFSAYRWEAQVLGGKWDTCWSCVYQAFPADEAHARQVRGKSAGGQRSRQHLLSDLRVLLEVLGAVPMLRRDMRSLVVAPTWPSARRASALRHITGMGMPEAYTREFGGWFEALVASGVLPGGAKRTSRGTMVLAQDGHRCLSMAEKLIDDWFSAHGIGHEKEPLYPQHDRFNARKRKRADWRIGSVFVEYLGMMTEREYRERAGEKRRLSAALGLESVVLEPWDLGRLDEVLAWAV